MVKAFSSGSPDRDLDPRSPVYTIDVLDGLLLSEVHIWVSHKDRDNNVLSSLAKLGELHARPAVHNSRDDNIILW